MKKHRLTKKAFPSNINHFVKTGVEPLIGIADEKIPPGTMGNIRIRAFIHSDQPIFYKVVDNFYSIFMADRFISAGVHAFLVIIHPNATADIYVNEIPTIMQFVSKTNLNIFSLVAMKDIADIKELRFNGISLDEKDSLIYCFKVGWKFGLFFDFQAVNGKGRINVDEIYKELGSCYKQLAFQGVYATVSNLKLFEELLNDGWFPFFQFLDGDYEKIASAYLAGDEKQDQVRSVLDFYNRERVFSFVENWWKKEIFLQKKSILLAGIIAYLQFDQNGYINCIKTLYTEIDGILRLKYFSERGRQPSFSNLVDFIQEKANQSFGTPSSLAFPTSFYRYINDVVFRSFELETGSVEMSRHSSSHGVADPSKYTREKALQTILILDQIFFFIN
jgi:hypothetical protein